MSKLQKNGLLVGCSLFILFWLLIGCASVPRPQGQICVAHVPQNYNNCFDMQSDFDSNGDIIPGHNGTNIPLDLDNHVNMDPMSFASLKAYIEKIKQRMVNCGQ